jgi:DeoR/GlpR family transcriptional regulator of sugar metabolism
MSDPEDRMQYALAELEKHGRVSVQALAEHFHVSRETVRRDLKQLELDGHLRCIYGGGVKPRPDADEPIADRMRLNAREKARIAERAATLLRDHIKIFVDAGTTTLAFAKHLRNWPDITVYTNSLDIVALLADAGHPNLVAVGGDVRASYRAFMGPDPVDLVTRHLFDIAFVSIATVDSRFGFMDLGQDEANIRRALRKHSKQCVMLADSSKFGRQGSICTYEFRDVDILITDAPLKADFAVQMDQTQVKVLYA